MESTSKELYSKEIKDINSFDTLSWCPIKYIMRDTCKKYDKEIMKYLYDSNTIKPIYNCGEGDDDDINIDNIMLVDYSKYINAPINKIDTSSIKRATVQIKYRMMSKTNYNNSVRTLDDLPNGLIELKIYVDWLGGKSINICNLPTTLSKVRVFIDESISHLFNITVPFGCDLTFHKCQVKKIYYLY